MTLKTINFTLAFDIMMLPYHVVLRNITEKVLIVLLGKFWNFYSYPCPPLPLKGTARHGRTIGKHCNKKHDPYIVTRRETLEQSVCKGMKCRCLLVYSVFFFSSIVSTETMGILEFQHNIRLRFRRSFQVLLKIRNENVFWPLLMVHHYISERQELSIIYRK